MAKVTVPVGEPPPATATWIVTAPPRGTGSELALRPTVLAERATVWGRLPGAVASTAGRRRSVGGRDRKGDGPGGDARTRTDRGHRGGVGERLAVGRCCWVRTDRHHGRILVDCLDEHARCGTGEVWVAAVDGGDVLVRGEPSGRTALGRQQRRVDRDGAAAGKIGTVGHELDGPSRG